MTAQRRSDKNMIAGLLAFNPAELEARARQAAREATPFEETLPATRTTTQVSTEALQWLWDRVAAEMADLRQQLADEQLLRQEREKQTVALRARAIADAATLRHTRQDLADERAARISAERTAAALQAHVRAAASGRGEGMGPPAAQNDRRVTVLQEALAAEIQQRETLTEEARRLKAQLNEMAHLRAAWVAERDALLAATPAETGEDVAALTLRVKQLARVLVSERRARLISEQHLRRLLRAQGIVLTATDEDL